MNTSNSNEQPGKLQAPSVSTSCLKWSSSLKLRAKPQPPIASLRGLEIEGLCVGVVARASLMFGTAALLSVV